MIVFNLGILIFFKPLGAREGGGAMIWSHLPLPCLILGNHDCFLVLEAVWTKLKIKVGSRGRQAMLCNPAFTDTYHMLALGRPWPHRETKRVIGAVFREQMLPVDWPTVSLNGNKNETAAEKNKPKQKKKQCCKLLTSSGRLSLQCNP